MKGHERERVDDLYLPPQHARAWDEVTDGKLQTPLNTHGVVDLDALVALGKQTVENGYDWTSRLNDVHHLQWPEAFYADDELAHEFRETVDRKAFLPRQFHNWLHHITEPPPVPSEEVMKHTVDAERAIRALASTAALATRLTRMRWIPERKRAARLEKEYMNYQLYVENAREIPEEFLRVSPHELAAGSVEEMLEVSRRIGRRALTQIPMRMRGLVQQAA